MPCHGRRIGWACQCHIRRIFVSRVKDFGGTNGLSVKMDPNDVTAKKLEEERSSFVLPLKVRGVFSRSAGAGPGALLSVSKRKKGGKQFPSAQCPQLSFPLVVVIVLLSVLFLPPVGWQCWHGCCWPAKSALCLSWTDRLLCLLGR